MNHHHFSSAPLDERRLGIGAVAGLAGGAAEIAWILFYSGLGTVDGNGLARGVTATFSNSVAVSSAGVTVGVLIHMMIAILLGIAIALVSGKILPQVRSALLEPCFVVTGLVGVWAVNFYLILPVINPDFVHLLPLEASLASKVFFGISAAVVLSLSTGHRGQDRIRG